MRRDCARDRSRTVCGALQPPRAYQSFPFPAALDDFTLVEQAAAAGMAGVMLKSQLQSQPGQGPPSCESPAGAARDGCLRRDCAATRSGRAEPLRGGVISTEWVAACVDAHRGHRPRLAARCAGVFFSRPGISILNETGDLLPVVYEIMEVIKKYNGVLAPGHISPKDLLLCRAGRAYGVKMVLTHPEFDRTLMDTGTQRELASSGRSR